MPTNEDWKKACHEWLVHSLYASKGEDGEIVCWYCSYILHDIMRDHDPDCRLIKVIEQSR